MPNRSLLMTAANGTKTHNGVKTLTSRCQGLEQINENPNEWQINKELMRVNPCYEVNGLGFFMTKNDGSELLVFPKIQVGDIIAIREPHYKYGFWATIGVLESGKSKWAFVPTLSDVKFPDKKPEYSHIQKGFHSPPGWYLRPGMFMHAEDVRTHATCTAVTCGRLQEMDSWDCIHEGIERYYFNPKFQRTTEKPNEMLIEILFVVHLTYPLCF